MAGFLEYPEFDWERPLVDQKKYVKSRDDLRIKLIRILQERKKYEEPFKDLVEQYISLWETSQLLRQDIKLNGIRIDGKKNDSVSLQVNVNKQMMVMLEKLGIEAKELKSEDGEDI